MNASIFIFHFSFFISRSLIRQHPRELRRVHVRHRRRPAQLALARGRLAAQDVLLERLAPQKLAALGALEALRGAAVRLDLLLRHRVLYVVLAAAGLVLPPPGCGRRLRMVCIWLPSIRGSVSAMAVSRSSSTSRSRMRRPISGCAISRPRKKIVAFTLSPSSRKRSMCFFLNW